MIQFRRLLALTLLACMLCPAAQAATATPTPAPILLEEEVLQPPALIQSMLDEALLDAHEEKFCTRPEKVDYWWLDELMEEIALGEEAVRIRWKDGDELTLPLNPPHEHYIPSNAATRYNAYLEKLRSGEIRTKGRFIMGLHPSGEAAI